MDAGEVSKICRICCNHQLNDLVSLLGAENKTIVKKLRACADITIEHDDLLPKYICTKCFQNLNSAYNFKIQCEYMDQELRNSITNSLKKHTGLKIIRQNESSSLEDHISDSDGYDFDSGQTTMDDVESLLIKDEMDDPTAIDQCNTFLQFNENNPNNQVGSAQMVSNIFGTTAMEISPVVVNMENANGQDELTDQEMFSIKSEKITSPKFKRSFKCVTCNATFSVFAEYHEHTKTHGTNRFQCLVCNRWFARRYQLNAHQKTHSGVKLFECASCQKRYTNQSNLDRHVRICHKKERRHTCTTCQKTFTQLASLRLHQSVHVAEREFCCDICNNKFKTEVHLKLHKKRHMPTEYRPKRKYSPPKKTFQNTAKKLFICNECGKRFTSSALLRSHSQSHSLEKKHECNFCKKRFSFKQTLRNHIYLHTGEKRFECDVCHTSFRQLGHLQGHKLIHSGIKQHSCSICGKAFALRGNLTVHMRTHTRTTPYHCNICPKQFSDSNTLKRHHLMHQRKDQTNATIEQILVAPIVEEPTAQAPNHDATVSQTVNIEAPIIQAPNNQAQISQMPIPETIFQNVPLFNVNPNTIQFIAPSEMIGDNSELIFKIE